MSAGPITTNVIAKRVQSQSREKIEEDTNTYDKIVFPKCEIQMMASSFYRERGGLETCQHGIPYKHNDGIPYWKVKAYNDGIPYSTISHYYNGHIFPDSLYYNGWTSHTKDRLRGVTRILILCVCALCKWRDRISWTSLFWLSVFKNEYGLKSWLILETHTDFRYSGFFFS